MGADNICMKDVIGEFLQLLCKEVEDYIRGIHTYQADLSRRVQILEDKFDIKPTKTMEFPWENPLMQEKESDYDRAKRYQKAYEYQLNRAELLQLDRNALLRKLKAIGEKVNEAFCVNTVEQNNGNKS